MRLFFLRHGIAEDNADGRKNDAERELTPEGIAKMRTAAKVIRALGIQPAAIYSSPRVRARQTAEIVAEALRREVQIRESLNFNFSAAAIPARIAGHTAQDDILLVGHEPTFSLTIEALIGGGAVEMKKGGLARVDLTSTQPPFGVLVWLIAPRVFDALA
jgi:phosphohistidine phosphatase